MGRTVNVRDGDDRGAGVIRVQEPEELGVRKRDVKEAKCMVDRDLIENLRRKSDESEMFKRNNKRIHSGVGCSVIENETNFRKTR